MFFLSGRLFSICGATQPLLSSQTHFAGCSGCPPSLAPAYKASVWSPQESSKVISENSYLLKHPGTDSLLLCTLLKPQARVGTWGHRLFAAVLEWLQWLWRTRPLEKGWISVIPSSCWNSNSWGFCSNHFYITLSILWTSYCKLGQNSAIVVAWLHKWQWSSMK